MFFQKTQCFVRCECKQLRRHYSAVKFPQQNYEFHFPYLFAASAYHHALSFATRIIKIKNDKHIFLSQSAVANYISPWERIGRCLTKSLRTIRLSHANVHIYTYYGKFAPVRNFNLYSSTRCASLYLHWLGWV